MWGGQFDPRTGCHCSPHPEPGHSLPLTSANWGLGGRGSWGSLQPPLTRPPAPRKRREVARQHLAEGLPGTREEEAYALAYTCGAGAPTPTPLGGERSAESRVGRFSKQAAFPKHVGCCVFFLSFFPDLSKGFLFDTPLRGFPFLPVETGGVGHSGFRAWERKRRHGMPTSLYFSMTYQYAEVSGLHSFVHTSLGSVFFSGYPF